MLIVILKAKLVTSGADCLYQRHGDLSPACMNPYTTQFTLKGLPQPVQNCIYFLGFIAESSECFDGLVLMLDQFYYENSPNSVVEES